jgi:hypothetical protein
VDIVNFKSKTDMVAKELLKLQTSLSTSLQREMAVEHLVDNPQGNRLDHFMCKIKIHAVSKSQKIISS